MNETDKIIEFLRFFKVTDRLEISKKIDQYSYKDLKMKFFTLYEGSSQKEKIILEKLKFEDCLNLEEFIRKKFFYYKTYFKISFASIMDQIILNYFENLTEYKISPYVQKIDDFTTWIKIKLKKKGIILKFKSSNYNEKTIDHMETDSLDVINYDDIQYPENCI